MDSDFLESRKQNSVWTVAGGAIAVFFVLLIVFNIFGQQAVYVIGVCDGVAHFGHGFRGNHKTVFMILEDFRHGPLKLNNAKRYSALNSFLGVFDEIGHFSVA